MLHGKIVLIPGAKGGLGTFVTNAALEAGATVIGVSRSIRQTDFPNEAFAAMPAELNSVDAARTLAGDVVARFGRVDVVIHLVGGFYIGKRVEETEDATWEKMLDLNLRSALHVFQAVIPQMRRQGAGRILAIGSKAAVEPGALTAPYNVSKAALVSLVRTVAEENKDAGISANIVLPGTMDTLANRAAMPMADYSKWVDPRQVAGLLVHLASDGASHITGAVIPVYGAGE